MNWSWTGNHRTLVSAFATCPIPAAMPFEDAFADEPAEPVRISLRPAFRYRRRLPPRSPNRRLRLEPGHLERLDSHAHFATSVVCDNSFRIGRRQRGDWLDASVNRIVSTGVVAIVRLADYADAVEMVEALLKGGIDVVEFTYTNPAAGQAIQRVKATLGTQVVVGAGTVLDPETARSAILQGSDFVVTPILRPETIRLCRRYSVPTVIGAFSPTEILTAWEEGATFVKIFPAGSVGPRYLKDVSGPLPQVRLIPTGGVNLENASAFIQAGASVIAVGSNLVDEQTVAQKEWSLLTSRAEAFMTAVREARSR